jgi:chromosome segregation ATPase
MKIRAQLEESRGSLEAGSERINAEISQLRSTVGSLQDELVEARTEKDRVIGDSKDLGLRIVELESWNASSAGEIESLRASVQTMENELKFVRSERNAESDMVRAETVRLTTELEAVSAKFAEVQSELAREVENGVSLQARILQFEHVVEELKAKLTSTQAELQDALRSRSTNDKVASQCEQYLKAIQDVSFVIKTVTDKFLSPNASEVNSRAVSIEEEGSEAVAQLERHVKALLRLVEAVSDKSKILEKENMCLENKLRDYENINTTLREKADRSLVQRIIEPIMACKWAGTDANTRMAHGAVPVQPRHGSEMSQLISPPRQYGGMSP